MGLGKYSTPVTVTLGVFFGSVAVAMFAYVLLVRSSPLRPFMLGTSLGLMIVIGVVIMVVIDNRSAVDEVHKERSQLAAKNCPNFWSRTWDPCRRELTCSNNYVRPDGSTIYMFSDMEQSLNLNSYNTKSAQDKCSVFLETGVPDYPFVEMLNRCRASGQIGE